MHKFFLWSRPGILCCLTMLFLGVAASLSAPSAKGPWSAEGELIHRLRKELDEEAQGGFSGSVLVGRQGRILLHQSYGFIRGVPMRTTSRFWIASIGKQFVSVALLKLQEQRKLVLDDRIDKFFPDVPLDKQAITLRQLLAHLSGMPQSEAGENASSRQEAVSLILAEPLADKPGRRFIYSNSNYQLAAAVVEIASGKGYREFVKKELLARAGLHETGQATGVQEVAPVRGELPARLRNPKWGAQGFYSTTGDLFAWCNAMKSTVILSPESIRILFAPVSPISEGDAALGWFLGKTENGTRRIFTRGNEDFGANGVIYMYPETDTTIVVLSHGGDKTDSLSYARAVHASIEKVIID